MTFSRPLLVGGAIITLLSAVYATFHLGANQQSDSRINSSEINALRKGDMKKLIFAPQPLALVKTPFMDETKNNKFFSDYNGKYVLVNFWATWCVPCRHEMPSLDELQKELGSDTFEVITIATGHNQLPAIKNFFERAEITNLPILLDPNQDLAQEMSIFGLPSTVILDPSGREIARLRGDAEWSDENAFAIINALVASEGS